MLIFLKATCPETNSLHLKMGWLEDDPFPFGPGIFSLNFKDKKSKTATPS